MLRVQEKWEVFSFVGEREKEREKKRERERGVERPGKMRGLFFCG